MSYLSRIYRPFVPETRDWWFSLDSRVKEDIIETAFRGHIKYEFDSTQVVYDFYEDYITLTARCFDSNEGEEVGGTSTYPSRRIVTILSI